MSNNATSTARPLGVHVLSEHQFCPRAALLAWESGSDEGEERILGPRLDFFGDYSEQHFAEALAVAWNNVYFWLNWMAPAALLALLLWKFAGAWEGAVATLPFCFCVGKLWDAAWLVRHIGREQTLSYNATPWQVDLTNPEIREVNWWSLRKAGFDCLKPVDPHLAPDGRLVGKPWRMLTQGTTLRVPVVRKHRGGRTWGEQHIIRLAAYGYLIEQCEGAQAPFGILMFADSYDCLLVPLPTATRLRFERAWQAAEEFLRTVTQSDQYIPAAPRDQRCRGCPWGEPRLSQLGSETTLGETVLKPYLTNAPHKGQPFHCDCGDRFQWVPPHQDASALGIAMGD